MQMKPASKYDLKDLYQEIGLFDRKISYCQNLEKFESEAVRAAALQKLVNKRQTLVANAQALSEHGIACDAKYLPRSLQEPVATATPKEA
jgi:hypothetical protein